MGTAAGLICRLRMGLLAACAVAVALLLLPLDSVVDAAVADLRIRMASEASGPYHRRDLVEDAATAQSALRITQPPALAGTLMFAQGPTSGQHFRVTKEQAAAGQFDLQFRVVLPHSADGPYACSPFPTTRTQNDEGDLFAGSIIVAERRGGCAFAPKATTIQAAGAAAAAIHNCRDCADISELVRMTIPENVDMPIMFWTDKDGFTIRSYLENRRMHFAHQRDSSLPAPPPGDYTLPVMAALTGTGPIDPSEWSALKTIAATLRFTWQPTSEYSALRPWSDLLASPTLDPCLQRVLGLYCEAGHVVSIYLKYYDIIGSFDPAWGQLTRMRYFTLSENVPFTDTGITGPVPEEICAWTQLQSMQIEGNTITSLPECLGGLSQLQVLLVERNRIVALPTTLPASLVWLMAASNQLSALPTAAMARLVNLGELGMSYNPLQNWDAALLGPMVAGWSQLYTFNMYSCSLAGTLSADAFSGNKNLFVLDLSSNQLSGALPVLSNLSRLQRVSFKQNALTSAPTPTLTHLPAVETLDLSGNQIAGPVPPLTGCKVTNLMLNNNSFTGGIPASWAGTGVKTIYLGFNQLSGPLTPLSRLNSVELIHLQNNRIVAPVNQLLSLAVGELLDAIASASLLDLNLDSNLIRGGWGQGQLKDKRLTKLRMANNQLTNLPQDLWTIGGPLTHLNVNYNNLSGSFPQFHSSANVYFSALGLTLSSPQLPSALVYSTTYELSDEKWVECRPLRGLVDRGITIVTSAGVMRYVNCRCAVGYFGNAPRCVGMPLEVALAPDAHVHVVGAAPDADFINVLQRYDSNATGAMTSLPPRDGRVQVRLPPAFTDAWYGDRRFTAGLATSWSIDLRRQRMHRNTSVESDGHAAREHTAIGNGETMQPVRMITVRLHISSVFFRTSDNQLVVSQGTRSAQGAVQKQLSGADWLNSSIPHSNFTQQPAYSRRYASQLAALADARLVEVVVPGNSATVSFTSRDAAEAHWVATYSYDFICTEGQELNAANECALPVPPTLTPVSLATTAAAKTVLPTVLPVAGFLILLTFAWLLRERYVRQRAKQARDKRVAAGLVEEEELSLSEMAAELQRGPIRQLQRELLTGIVSTVVETGFILLVWLRIGSLLSASSAEAIAEDRLAVADVTVGVVSTMAFLANGVARFLAMRELANEIRRAATHRRHDDAHQLAIIKRKILGLQISSVALIFDSLPVSCLNLARLLIDADRSAQLVLSFMFGMLLIGAKLTQLLDLPQLKDQRLGIMVQLASAKAHVDRGHAADLTGPAAKDSSLCAWAVVESHGDFVSPLASLDAAPESPGEQVAGETPVAAAVATADPAQIEIELELCSLPSPSARGGCTDRNTCDDIGRSAPSHAVALCAREDLVQALEETGPVAADRCGVLVHPDLDHANATGYESPQASPSVCASPSAQRLEQQQQQVQQQPVRSDHDALQAGIDGAGAVSNSSSTRLSRPSSSAMTVRLHAAPAAVAAVASAADAPSPSAAKNTLKPAHLRVQQQHARRRPSAPADELVQSAAVPSQ